MTWCWCWCWCWCGCNHRAQSFKTRQFFSTPQRPHRFVQFAHKYRVYSGRRSCACSTSNRSAIAGVCRKQVHGTCVRCAHMVFRMPISRFDTLSQLEYFIIAQSHDIPLPLPSTPLTLSYPLFSPLLVRMSCGCRRTDRSSSSKRCCSQR